MAGPPPEGEVVPRTLAAYGVHVMEPDDPQGEEAAERRDNHRSLVVVAVGVLVIVAASALVVGTERPPQVSAPKPAPTSTLTVTGGQLPTAVYHEDGDGEHGDNTPLYYPTQSPTPKR
ncbi:MAG: hypothetical protein JWQ12_1900 [Glaciihabitans sp.]|nr:hypothetical protein [Glaciihabitans sp.]